MEKSSEIDKAKINADDPRLAKFKLFAELSREGLHLLLEHGSIVKHAAGEKIITAGEPGHCLFILLNGTASVTISGGEQDFTIATLGPGDFLGEIALVDDGPRSADVTAIEPCEMLCVSRMTIGVLAGLQPDAAIHILAAIGRALVARLRKGNQQYLDLLLLGRPA